ncbi:hypothetical protein H920_01532 [Fukomys damarensis]|uniref:Uncharacterized protein n=1 Tax=Fukomys damarensis TaxID=885580 RepID=A0A091EN40_FUKDA|nr:hypothetical protein H920_01532 [Fukomys damarensis]
MGDSPLPDTHAEQGLMKRIRRRSTKELSNKEGGKVAAVELGHCAAADCGCEMESGASPSSGNHSANCPEHQLELTVNSRLRLLI